MFEILWAAAMVIILSSAITGLIKVFRSAGRQAHVDNLLSAKGVKADLRSGSAASKPVLVREGMGGDPTKAEEPDR